MAIEPPYDIEGFPEHYRDTPYDQLPPGLQRKLHRANPELSETPHPARQPLDEAAASNLDEVPEGASFPHHKGGGWYVLSDGTSVQGEDAAIEGQDALDNA